jgi:hypothetical protein
VPVLEACVPWEGTAADLRDRSPSCSAATLGGDGWVPAG